MPDDKQNSSRNQQPVGDQQQKDHDDSLFRRFFRSRIVQIVLATLVIVIALLYWWHSSHYESTDDAQVDGHLNQISSRIGGSIVKVHFDDNQYVKAGSVLVEIDPTDYRVAYQRAQAEQAEAAAAVAAAQTGVPITSIETASQVTAATARVAGAQAGVGARRKELDAARARLKEAEAYDQKAQNDLRRFTPLVARDVISRQQYDQIVAAAKAAAATTDAARAAVRVAGQQVKQAGDQLAQMRAELRSAGTAPQQVRVSRARLSSSEAALKRTTAALEQARLNLEYTRIVAPVDGVTGKKTVEVGQNVVPGQALAYLVPLGDLWVTANFKETQLRKLRPGQRATIAVDAFGTKYDGYVESIGAASGSRFSLFPPENATGNYVKVVQRIPVRIRFARGQDPGRRLRPGMSVVPKVTLK